jgi:sigma-B regulation protein RsbU (phosphoserine phosphatase)
MGTPGMSLPKHSPETRKRELVVLLVDDQAIVGEAVRQMLADQSDIKFHHCQNPLQALDMATELRPTVILQDLVMPDIDGLTLVKFFRAHSPTQNTPLVVLSTKEEPVIKAEAFARGANDYMVKLPDKLEVVARIRYHSLAYIHMVERNEAFEALAASEKRLAAEMSAGAKYVASLLPAPLDTPLRIDWRFVPSAELGGDSLGYFALDEGRFAVYMLDVTGHGLASALLGVTVSNLIRARALPGADFAQPSQILAGLNRSFQMEKQDGRFFTMWYGVIEHATRKLTWSGGGHPAALLFRGGHSSPQQLESQNPGVGMFDWDNFEQQEIELPEDSRLFIYSDGAFEIHKQDGTDWTFEEFIQFLSQPEDSQQHIMDRLIRHVRMLKGADVLDDDFSILELRTERVQNRTKRRRGTASKDTPVAGREQ